ncbi:AAA family ATPase [Zafaria sp. Z1313]|uniref:AAA family ATPase n=1 Tax=Zafaria sp. Z1313 TaxID=3423202 RepID=UPI003D302C64
MGTPLDDFLRHFAELSDAAHAARQAEHTGPQLGDALDKHLGADASALPVVTEEHPAHRLADVARALGVLCGGGARLIGVGGPERHHLALQDMLVQRRGFQLPLAEPEYRSVAIGPDEQERVVSFGVHLFHRGAVPLAVLLRAANPQFGRGATSLEVIGPDAGAVDGFIGEVRGHLRRHSIYQGHVVSFTANEFEATTGGVTFHRRPELEASDVVLPAGVLERIERHVVDLGAHRGALLAAGQHLKRGVLLYGPPGTGKTHTVRYLLGRARGTTAVLLSGGSLALVSEAARLARALQPAVVVLEDCDLVAGDRGHLPGAQPLLFEVLEAMDGLDPDADVAFVLTTNRVDLLERALAQRPGRVDLAVEIPRPEREQRRALLALYADGLDLDDAVLDAAAGRTEGTTASFAKELVRRAVLAAALAGTQVEGRHLAGAVEELMADGAALTRSLLGGDGSGVPPGTAPDAGPGGDEGVDFGFVAGPAQGSFGWFAQAPGTGQVFGPGAHASSLDVGWDEPDARDAAAGPVDGD